MDATTGTLPASGIRVTFMGELPAITGRHKLQVDLPQSATIGELLSILSDEFGDQFRCRVFSTPTKLHQTMLIFVDGEDIKQRGGLAATLGTGDVEVFMLPMIEGG